METEIQGTVLSVGSRTTPNGKTIYEVALSDGNSYATFNGALYTKAQQLQGQQISARVKIEQKGQYTNYYLNELGPAGQPLPAARGPVATPQPAAASPAQNPPSTFNGGMSPEREQKIVKQSSFATAFNFVGHIFAGSGDLDAAKEFAHELAAELYAHVFGQEVEKKQPVAAGGPETPSDGIPW